MALVILVTKKAVNKVQDGLFNITLNLLVTDGAVPVINKDFTQKYRTGDDIPAKALKFQEVMQAEIAKYKSEDVIYDTALLTNVVTWLNANLTG